jgi:hypothetical protein
MFLMGKRISSMVMVFSLKSNTGPISSGVFNYIRAQVHLFTCRILYERKLDFTNLFGFEGAVGSAP